MGDPAPPPPPTRPQHGDRLKWALTTAGGLASGSAISDLSSSTVWAPATAIAFAVAFVLLVAYRLRELPPGAPLIRYTARACLAAAGSAAVVAIISQSISSTTAWTGWAVLVATAFGIAGAVTPASEEESCPPFSRWHSSALGWR